MMKQHTVQFFCTFLTLTLITGCAAPLPKKVTARQVIENNLEPSYITAFEGLNFRDTHNATQEPQLFEAEINSHLAWFNYFTEQTTRPIIPSFMLKVNPKVQVRMFREASLPVKTPGYLPRGTAFFWWSKAQEIDRNLNYFSVMLSHHSNGQAGAFLNPDRTLNTTNGSFGTNFIEVAYHHFSTQAALPFGIPWIGRVLLPAWKRFAFEQHITPWREEHLEDLYQTSRIIVEFRTIGRSLGVANNRWLFKFYVSGSYILTGKKFVLPDERHFDNRAEAGIGDKLHVTMALQVRPPQGRILTWENISLFTKVDVGYDYYNIHFAEQIARFQFGFAGDRFLLTGKQAHAEDVNSTDNRFKDESL